MPISLSYISSFSGALGAVFPIGPVDDGIRGLQRELVRLGYLQNNTGPFGADGYWGPRMALALRQASAYVGWTEEPYAPANADSLSRGQVTIPDELIAMIRAAAPDPNAVAAGTTPSTTPAPAPSAPAPNNARWIAGLGIGLVMITLGAIYAMKKDDEEEQGFAGFRLGSTPEMHMDKALRHLDKFAELTRSASNTDNHERGKKLIQEAKNNLLLAYDNIEAANDDPRFTKSDETKLKKIREMWIRADGTFRAVQARRARFPF